MNGIVFPSVRSEISHEGIFVFGEIGVGPGNLAVHQALFDFADEESQLISLNASIPFLEFFDVTDRVRVFDPRALRHRRQIRVAGSRGRITDAAAAVNAVVENIDDQIFRPQVAQRREIEEREQHAAVGVERDHFAVRQSQSQSGGDADGAAHHADQQVAFMACDRCDHSMRWPLCEVTTS